MALDGARRAVFGEYSVQPGDQASDGERERETDATPQSARTSRGSGCRRVRPGSSNCGADFEVSARDHRNHRNRGTTPKCSRCPHGAKPPKVTDAMRRYWLDRFTLDDLRELADGLWPDERLR